MVPLAGELLLRAHAIQDLSVAYGVARDHLRGGSEIEVDKAVKSALLNLFDQDLILFFRSSWDDGYSVDPKAVINSIGAKSSLNYPREARKRTRPMRWFSFAARRSERNGLRTMLPL